ncbi:MAG: TlpA disulfide reductase family protein [Pirellulaceae bacterium]
MKRFHSLWLIVALLNTGCNAPNETIPAIKSAGTTDVELVDGLADKQTSSETAINVEVIDADELQQRVQKHVGKIVVLDIWSNSCPPCMEEFHNLVDLSQKYPDQVVAMSFNVNYIGLKKSPPESTLPEVTDFLASKNALSVHNFLSSTQDSDVLEKYEVDSIPAIIIYDASGRVAAKLTDSSAGEGGLTYAKNVLPKIEEMLQ